MGLIPKITCRRCKREYSALRSRCPHCGTRKVKQSERTPATTAGTRPGTAANSRMNSNAKWQMIFGLVIVIAVIIAVIAIIIVSTGDGGDTKPPDTSPTPDVSAAPVTQSAAPVPTPSPSPEVEITSITISYFNDPRTEFMAAVGSETPLTATVYPLTAEATVTWSSGDESVATVSQDGVVKGVGAGVTYITAECGGVTADCKVYIN